VVTLSTGQTQVFTANVPVLWPPSLSGPGLYTVPPKISKAQIPVVEPTSPHGTGSAEVFVSPAGSFSLQPARATVSAGGSLDLTAVEGPPADPNQSPGKPLDVDWMSPEIGTLTPGSSPGTMTPVSTTGTLTARFSAVVPGIVRPTTVMILARVRGDATRVAGAWVTVLPASVPPGTTADGCGSDVAALLSLIAIMGALGGIIHGISSFTTYVGNRQFLTSWAWWYIFKPFLSALVAIVVFLVFRSGFSGADLSLNGADCLKVAAFAGLIGLFAEPATLKLKDIFNTLFTPKDDPRKDAAQDGSGSQPILTSLDPATVTAGQEPIPELTLKGSGFSPDCQVRIGTILRKPIQFSSTQLVVALGKDEIANPGKLDVVVFNRPPDGKASSSVPLPILAKAAAGAEKPADPTADKKEG
jgi:hypothetical protein